MMVAALGLASNGFAQHEDEVLYTMYRYHPKAKLLEMNIDSCFVFLSRNDSQILKQVMVYDMLGREVEFRDYDCGCSYRNAYDGHELLITQKLWDWDFGEGPTDSFVYDKNGQMVVSYSLFMGEVNRETHYSYVDGLLMEEKGDGFKTQYRYEKGRRTGYTTQRMEHPEVYEYTYDANNDLVGVYQVQPDGSREIRYGLAYHNHLLNSMEVFSKGRITQRYRTTYDENAFIVRHIQETDFSKNGKARDVKVYQYRYQPRS